MILFVRMETGYKNSILYVATGTGNSLRLAKGFASRLQSSSIIPVEKANPKSDITGGPSELVGIFMPTHGFTAPWHVIKFAALLPFRPGTHAFCVAARATIKIGQIHIPGISGSGYFLIALLLFLKGFRVRGFISIDTPSNWYAAHPIQKVKTNAAIIERAEGIVTGFADKLLEGRHIWFSWNSLWEFTLGALLSYISFMYLIYARFFFAKLTFYNTNCDGCAICARNCPVEAIKMIGGKPFWKYSCESCMRCAAICPLNAVEAGHSWAVLLTYGTAVPPLMYLLTWLETYLPGISRIEGGVPEFLFTLVNFYIALSVCYFLFFLSIRIPFVDKVFSLTTLTHYWGRYKEESIEWKEVRPPKRKTQTPEDV